MTTNEPTSKESRLAQKVTSELDLTSKMVWSEMSTEAQGAFVRGVVASA